MIKTGEKIKSIPKSNTIMFYW